MPTLLRFVMILGALAAVVYGAMLALVLLVEPKQSEMIVRIPPERLNHSAP